MDTVELYAAAEKAIKTLATSLDDGIRDSVGAVFNYQENELEVFDELQHRREYFAALEDQDVSVKDFRRTAFTFFESIVVANDDGLLRANG